MLEGIKEGFGYGIGVFAAVILLQVIADGIRGANKDNTEESE